MMPAVFSHISRRDRAAAWALAVVLSLAAGPALGQTNGSWNVDNSGTWSVNSNWFNNTVAGGITGTARFTNDITATRTVTLDTSRSLGAFIFGDSGTATAASWIVTSVATGTTMTMNNGTNSALITVNALGAGATATISAVLASSTSPAIVKNGVGTLVLAGTNNFTNLQITEGTLQISTDRNLGAQPGGFVADRLTISNGAILSTSTAVTINSNRGITIGSGGGTLNNANGTFTYAGRFTGAGQTLTTTGPSGLSLSNGTGTPSDVNWNFSGSASRIFLTSTNALGSGTVQVGNNVRLVPSVAGFAVSNQVTLVNGAGISARTGAATFSNVVFPSTGVVIFNKDDQSTFGLTISSGGALTGDLTVDTSQQTTNAVGDVTLSGIFSGASGALIKAGTGTSGRLILTAANTYGGNTTINTGTLQIGNGGTVGSLSTSSVITGSAGATLAFNRSDTITSGVDFKDAIIGGINLAQLGSGTLILTASNTIGKTSITNGVLQISNANQLGAAPGSFTADQLTISNGATLRTTTGGLSLPANRGITIGSGGGKIDANGTGGNLIINSRFTGSGQTVTVTGSTGIRLGNTTGAASNVNWDFAMNSSQRAFFDNSNALGTGTVTVRSGVRLVSMQAAPTNGEVTNAVTLQDGAGLSARSTGGAVTYTTVTLPSTGTLIFNQDDLATSALTIASGKELTGLLTINTSQGGANAVGDVTLSGNFSGASGGITKIGTGASGRLILGGVNTYGGNTTISTGTLALAATASIANSAAISVASGATFDVSAVSGGFTLGAGQVLGGSGTVLGAVTALGTIAPGSSPGTLTFTDDLTLDSGSILNYELIGTDMTVGSAINDLITLSGNLTLAGTLNVTETVAGSFLSAVEGDSWRLFSYTGEITDNGLSLGTIPTLSDGLSFQIDTSTDNQVNLVVVPEPAAIVTVIAGLGMLGVVAARRRLQRVVR